MDLVLRRDGSWKMEEIITIRFGLLGIEEGVNSRVSEDPVVDCRMREKDLQSIG